MTELTLIVRYLSWFLLASSMFLAGLYLKPHDLRMAAKRYKLISKALIANAIIIPLIGLGLYEITPMSPSVQVAFLMVTFSFGIPLVLNFVKGMRANVPFATVLVFVLAITTALTMPILLRLVLPVDFSAFRTFIFVILFIVLFQLIPLVIGLILGDSGTIRRYLLRPLGILTASAGAALLGLVVIAGLAGIAKVGVWPPLSMVVLTVSSLAVGWIFGGPELIDRKVLAVNSALRNFPIGMLLATTIFADTVDAIGVAVFAAIMILSVLIFSRFASRLKSRTEKTVNAEPLKGG